MIKVSYRFPAGVDAQKQATIIAVGQTVGSWGAQFAHREQALRAHLGQVLDVSRNADGSTCAQIGFPLRNTEGDIPSLLTMIFGKFSLAGPARIVDIQLPAGYGLAAKFGIEGLRQLTGVQGRPFIMGIFKPALGLTADDHAQLLREVASAGLDIIKDDEINFDLETAPTLERVIACRRVIDEVKAQTGKELLYAVNLSGRADQIVDKARRLIDHGANAFLFNVLCYGYSVLEALAAHPEVKVPLFTHPAFAGAIGGSVDYGVDYPVLLGTLNRYAGADAVLYPSHYGSLPFPRQAELALAEALRAPLDGRPAALPVPSAGISPGIVGRALRDYGEDVALNAGSSIFDHPAGPAAGTSAFFDALTVVRDGGMLRADEVPPGVLRTALEKWGGE